jgi:signal transduction histidine kinase
METKARRALGGREMLILGVGLLAAALLLWAGWQTRERARWRGAAEFQRLAGEAERRIERAAAELFERDGAPPGARFAFELAAPQAPVPLLELAPFPAEGWSDFDLELSALQRPGPAELRLAALETLLAAQPAAARRPAGLLLAVQLSAAAPRPESLATWLRAALDVPPEAAFEGHSILALCLLAGAAEGPAELLEEGAARAIGAWAAGQLAWPAPADRFELGAEGPRWRADPRPAVLLERLTALLGPEQRAALAASLAQLADPASRQARAFAAAGPLPSVQGPNRGPGLAGEPTAPGRWTPLLERGAGWWWRGRGALPPRVAWIPEPALVEELEGAAAADQAGFRLQPASAAPPSGAFRGRPLDLGPGLPSLCLAHEDPEGLERQALAASAPLRAGAYTLAALLLAAAALGARALARERRLAELEQRFVAGISHDLRTPLASILLMSESLAAGQVPPESQRQRYFPALQREAERLRRRVDDLLDFSRLRRGLGPRLSPEPVRPAALAAELEAELREECARAGVALEFSTAELPEELVLDADALRRALGNLVGNALRHSGSPSVEVRLSGRPDGLEIEVADRGRGIPAGQRERAFLPFVQLAGTRAELGGSGLGLSIVRELARAHGGDARLVEQTGPGTRIRLSFQELEPA